ncbi:hypothetical protein OG400_23570 [Micromonospora ureilytica]|nr:hypothetical protein OG400_23570 [Micromonospora ureilytica]
MSRSRPAPRIGRYSQVTVPTNRYSAQILDSFRYGLTETVQDLVVHCPTGEMRHLPSVGAVLAPPESHPYLVVKQDNNGTTFVISNATKPRG